MSKIARQKGQIVTRFAPSPTGMFHVGGIRSSLYNYLFARKQGGIYILRCEDTDRRRSKKEYEENFLEVFRWLGLDHDEYYRQSERTELYRGYLERLISEGKAYVSKETAEKEGDREEVIRFKNPGTDIIFDDVVLGEIKFNTAELGDFVIARSLEEPLYNLAVVIDDHEMGVTHIIRGQEHVSNTPRQILIQEAIGAGRPIYAHASIILNESRAKLSKRDPLVRPALEYRDDGYLPDAVLNFMALLGWNPGTEQEIFAKNELIEAFSLERMQKPGAVFNSEKLEWINKEHIKRLDPEMLTKEVRKAISERTIALPQYSDARLERAAATLTERITHFGEIRNMEETGELTYLFSAPSIENTDILVWKDLRGSPEGAKVTATHLTEVARLWGAHVGAWSAEDLKQLIWEYAERSGRGNVLWPVRVSLSGKERSPDPFTLAYILGKHETLLRINDAITLLSHL